MADDWKVGDLALCVNATPDEHDPLASFLRRGRVYTVAVVGPREFGPGIAIGFRDLPTKGNPTRAYGWSIWRFIKVTPPAADEFDREIIANMQPAPVPA